MCNALMDQRLPVCKMGETVPFNSSIAQWDTCPGYQTSPVSQLTIRVPLPGNTAYLEAQPSGLLSFISSSACGAFRKDKDRKDVTSALAPLEE